MDCKYVLKIKVAVKQHNGGVCYDANPLCIELEKMGITRYRMRFPQTSDKCKYDENGNLLVPVYFESKKDLLACKMISE